MDDCSDEDVYCICNSPLVESDKRSYRRFKEMLGGSRQILSSEQQSGLSYRGVRHQDLMDDMERKYVEKLASLRTPSKNRPVTTDAFPENSKDRWQRSQSPTKNSLWGSFKGLFGQNESASPFLTVSLSAPMSRLVPYSSRNSWHLASLCAVFVLTYLFSSAKRMKSCPSLRQLGYFGKKKT